MYLPRLSYKLMHSQEGATGGKLMAISWLSSGRLSSNRPKHLAKHLLDFKLKVLSRSQTALLGAPRLPCVAGSGLKRIDFGVPVGIKIHAKICPPVFMKLPV
jgi:hypothetical protein